MADGFSAEVRIIGPGIAGDGFRARILEAATVAMNAIGAHAAERAQANAPFGTLPKFGGGSINPGDLRRATRHTVRATGGRITAKILVDIHYAFRMHEELTPAGILQLGPNSRNQPGTPEGGVGGKFIERVVNFHLVAYTKFLRDAVKSNLTKQQKRKVTVKRITEGTS